MKKIHYAVLKMIQINDIFFYNYIIVSFFIKFYMMTRYHYSHAEDFIVCMSLAQCMENVPKNEIFFSRISPERINALCNIVTKLASALNRRIKCWTWSSFLVSANLIRFSLLFLCVDDFKINSIFGSNRVNRVQLVYSTQL